MPPEDDQTIDLAGYKTVEDLVKGYRSSSDEAKRLKAERDAERNTRLLLEQQAAQRSNGNGNGRKSPEELLEEFGIPVAALEQLIDARADQKLGAVLTPIAKGASARNSMLSSYPDYQKYEADVAKYIGEDPALTEKYTKMFNVDPEAAMEFAFLKYGQAHPAKSGGTPSDPQRQARSETQIPSSRSGDARTMPQANQDERLTRSWEHFQKTGDPRAFAKARLSQVISDDFLSR